MNSARDEGRKGFTKLPDEGLNNWSTVQRVAATFQPRKFRALIVKKVKEQGGCIILCEEKNSSQHFQIKRDLREREREGKSEGRPSSGRSR